MQTMEEVSKDTTFSRTRRCCIISNQIRLRQTIRLQHEYMSDCDEVKTSKGNSMRYDMKSFSHYLGCYVTSFLLKDSPISPIKMRQVMIEPPLKVALLYTLEGHIVTSLSMILT